MYREEDSCSGEEEGEDRETYAKLSAIRVIKRDTSVAIAHSTCGIGKTAKIHGTNEAKDVKR